LVWILLTSFVHLYSFQPWPSISSSWHWSCDFNFSALRAGERSCWSIDMTWSLAVVDGARVKSWFAYAMAVVRALIFAAGVWLRATWYTNHADASPR
ncbi:hypothetical protein GGX14DRAFT_484517, partial [Mycena pura]